MTKSYTFKGKTGTEYLLDYLESNAVASTKGITKAMMADIDPHEGEMNRSTINYYIRSLRDAGKIHSPRTGLWMFGPAEKSNKNSEGYSDPTASQAVLNTVTPEMDETSAYDGPVYGEIWEYDSGKNGNVKVLILSTNDDFANVLYVYPTSEKYSKVYCYTPICGGYLCVFPTRVYCKPLKYFEQKTDFVLSDEDLKRVKAGLAATFGIFPPTKIVEKVVTKEVEVPVEVVKEVPVEKVVEKIKRVEIAVPPEGMEKQIEMMQLKIDIYENVMKAQGLLS